MTVRRYWIAYDISNDRERNRVERCLARYGQRLQKSLFFCVLDTPRLMRLQGELNALNCQSGFIIIAALAEPLDYACIGSTQVKLEEEWAWVIH